ncbi:hypothetical protein [Streptomyces sp. Qhu_M48]|uniref:hypothetical protein n=1 Tax=Streptomyces sp. Qhu_M48 TaxID=3435889 RepID=UPI003F4FA09A
MAAWATTECRCGHPRFRHGEPRFAGSCGLCRCEVFDLPPPAPGYRDPEPTPPEPPRRPHPDCPYQDPDCNGYHGDYYYSP